MKRQRGRKSERLIDRSVCYRADGREVRYKNDTSKKIR